MDAIGLFLIMFAIFCGPFIYIYYRFLRTLRDLLRAVSEQNRGISPGLVWLNWIPVFSFAWMFVTIIKIRDSARKEFQTRGVKEDGGAGFGVGMTFAVASVLSEIGVPPSWIDNEDVLWGVVTLGGILGLVSFVCWILYWIKAAHLRDMLVNTIGARPFSAAAVTYQPASWQVAQESAPAGPVVAGTTTPQPWSSGQQPVQGQAPAGGWLNGQDAPAQPQAAQQGGGWLGARDSVASQVTCPACGAPGQAAGGSCRYCLRPISPVRPTQLGVSGSPSAGTTPTAGGFAAASTVVSCRYCGTQLRPDAGFCSLCGRAVVQ